MIEISNKNLKGYTFIDLFAGIGGFRIALESLGAKCVYSSECDTYAKETYFNNFKDMPDGDITKVNEESIPDHDIMCAGFPCQAFSISGKQKGFEDSRGTLFFDVARIVKYKRPKVIFMENVKNFAKHDKGRTLEVVKKTIEDLGYDFYYEVLNSVNFGVPQNRERIYMICFRKDINIKSFSFPNSFKLVTFLEDYLLPNNETKEYIVYDRKMELKDISVNSNKNKSIRIGSVGKGGQGERIYSPKGIAITLSANGGGVFAKTGGYLVDGFARKLHPRECARIMGFPENFWIHTRDNQAYKQFGNSVVIDLVQLISFEIGESLNESKTNVKSINE